MLRLKFCLLRNAQGLENGKTSSSTYSFNNSHTSTYSSNNDHIFERLLNDYWILKTINVIRLLPENVHPMFDMLIIDA